MENNEKETCNVENEMNKQESKGKRMVEVPCEVGDIVYYCKQSISKVEVIEVAPYGNAYDDGVYNVVLKSGIPGSIIRVRFRDFNNTVFKSEEEALAKIVQPLTPEIGEIKEEIMQCKTVDKMVDVINKFVPFSHFDEQVAFLSGMFGYYIKDVYGRKSAENRDLILRAVLKDKKEDAENERKGI